MKERPCHTISLIDLHHFHLLLDVVVSIASKTDFVRAHYLCPKLWEILPTLFFLHLKHEKKILWPASFEGGNSAQLQHLKDIIRPVLSWERERRTRIRCIPEWAYAPLSISHFPQEAAQSVKDCKFNSLRSRLGSSIPGEPFLLSDGRSHLLVQTLFSERLKPPVSFPWFQSILSSAVWWPHYSLWCPTQKKICASAT